MDKRESPTGNKDSLRRGCGCFLVVVGAVIALFALLIAIASVIGEKQGYDRNETEWAEYNENLPVIDSLYEAGVPDSIIEARYPQPQIRQGGFAIIFGGLTALVILVVGAIPLIIGIVLLRNRKKKES
ncbi:MAG: hypothetical protein IJL29_08920 [Prevotella sp.]|nr:hypothetical protein [Prevotella sp.]MBQ6033117.1 hypothetical protein [Prevotella sp.]